MGQQGHCHELVREAKRLLQTLKELQELLPSSICVEHLTTISVLYMSGLWGRGQNGKHI